MKPKVAFFLSVAFLLLLGSAAVGFAQSPPPASFASPVNYAAAGNTPVPVAMGDFNGDGILDMVVANYDGTVNVLLGKGDGTFNMTPSYTYGFSGEEYTVNLSAVVVGDFNNDGILDFAVLDVTDDWVVVFAGHNNGSGKGDGTFYQYSTTLVGSNPCSAAVGDFNGDGVPDLAVANCGSNDVTVLLNTYTNTDSGWRYLLTLTNDYALSPLSPSIAVGDFNGDGKPDLAVAGYRSGDDESSGGTVSVLLGNGNGSFTVPESYTYYGSVNPAWVAVGDFNGDGKLDSAVADYNGTVDVFLGNGDGTFQAPALYSEPGTYPTPVSVAVGDFNGDGIPDLAVADNNGGVDVSLGKGDGTFQPAVAYGATLYPESVAVGDFNGDGKPDLAVADNGGGVSVLLNTTVPPITLPLIPTGGTNLYQFNHTVFNYKVTYPALVGHPTGVYLSVWPILISQADLNARLNGQFPGATLVPYLGTGGYGILFRLTCQDSSGNTVTCPTTIGTNTFYTSWNSPAGQTITNPAFLMAEIAAVGTQTWSNIFTAFSSTRTDPTVSGRSSPGFSDFVVVQNPSGVLVMGPQAMQGDLKLSPGTTLKAGYDFTMPGSHPGATVDFTGAEVTFAWTCVSGTGSGVLVVPMANQSYTDAQNSSAWYPSGDQKSSLVYQGSIAVPNVCSGGLVRFQAGGTFSTGISSTDTKNKVNVRWHYSGGGSAGGWSGTQSVVP